MTSTLAQHAPENPTTQPRAVTTDGRRPTTGAPITTERSSVVGGPSSAARRWFGTVAELLETPNLVAHQLESYRRFTEEGLRDLFAETSPITDYTGKNLALELSVPPDGPFGTPKYTEGECRDRDLTYSAPLYADARLHVLRTGEIKESRLFLGDFPLMTERGTFVVNGSERVVVSQLVRSPGIYYSAAEDPVTGRKLFGAKLIPNRGAWLELDTSAKDVLSIKVDRKRKLPVTTFLRALAPEWGTDEALLDLLRDVDTDPEHPYIESTIGLNGTTRRDPAHSHEQALLDLHRRLRPGDPATVDSARTLLHNHFFNPRRYDLSRVGRYKLEKRLRRDDRGAPDVGADPRVRPVGQGRVDTWVGPYGNSARSSNALMTLTPADLLAAVRELIRLNVTQGRPDEIDHLGNRRVRAVGELIQNQFRIGLMRLERTVRERMTVQDAETATPASLVNVRPLVASMKEFFAASQLSQFMDQTNPLAELTHRRRLSAMGPGGLSRDRAGFEVRDVHESHYGRICPIETQEGTSIGLVGALATHGRIDEYGFIQTPYRRVVQDPARGRAQVTDEIVYLTADEEERFVIAQANSPVDAEGHLTEFRVAGRYEGTFGAFAPERVDLMDVSPRQVVSVASAMIPFLEHDDAARALMGANYQRQAVPLLRPEAPLVATGMESQAARDSGRLILAEAAGTVVSATAEAVVVQELRGSERRYPLHQFVRTNDGTCLHHRPLVSRGDAVEAGQALADTQSTEGGELALGQNVLCAFMFWEGANYEDAIVISERLVQEDHFTSIHLEHYEVDARDTKLGPEEITRDLPNLSEETLRNLDEGGCIYVGARVVAGDVLVGKVTPKGETELTAEERLLRAIFGEKAREVKDSSLRVHAGEYGTVVDVRRFSRAGGDDLPPGVEARVRVTVAVKRKLTTGDKLSGRHGNKGIIARVLPVEDMPHLEDGTPVDIVLSPLGAPSRMNVGTVLEAHLGWAAHALGMKVASPVFDSAREEEIEALLQEAGLPRSGKATLIDGRTGEPFEQEVCVGYVYMLKLHHLVEDKVHARSTGPYSLITQQPLGGKAQFGGQRLGLMEVWALEAYGAAHTLQEMLTVKSDDDTGRVKTYEAIVKGEPLPEPGVPAAFRLLVKELQSLGLSVELFDEQDDHIVLAEDVAADQDAVPALGVNLSGWEDRD